MSEVPEIVVVAGGGEGAAVAGVLVGDDDVDVDEVDYGTLQKKQKDIRLQLKKNPELNSKNESFEDL